MQFKIGLLGASGKMGTELRQILSTPYRIGNDFLELSLAVSTPEEILNESRKTELWSQIQLWIDFSHPSATLSLLKTIDCPILIGTTGFDEVGTRAIEIYAQKNRVGFFSNTSRGIAWIQKALRKAPFLPQPGLNVVVDDEHHAQKKDSPSGTARSLLQTLHSLGHEQVQVHTTRAGKIVGYHRVSFLWNDEEIRIEHRVTNRRIFAEGALELAERLLKKPEPGLYTWENL